MFFYSPLRTICVIEKTLGWLRTDTLNKSDSASRLSVLVSSLRDGEVSCKTWYLSHIFSLSGALRLTTTYFRFRQGAVVTIAPGKAKRTHELQLASMAQLTAKSSSQQFLLRLLNVVIQLSESKRNDEQAALLGKITNIH